MLLSYKDESVQHLPETCLLTNGLVIELLRFKDEHAECTYRSMYNWVQDLYGRKWPIEAAPTLQAFTKSVERLKAKLSKFKKQHTRQEKNASVDYFLKEEYTLPEIGLCKGRVLHFSPVKESQSVAKEATEGETVNYHPQKYKEMQQRMYSLTRNANKKFFFFSCPHTLKLDVVFQPMLNTIFHCVIRLS